MIEAWRFWGFGAAVAWAAVAGPAFADVEIGVTVSAVGPAASLGIPEKNTIALLPKAIGERKASYVVLGDATDSTQAVKNARKLTSGDRVDALIGSTVVPNALAMTGVAAQTPMTSMAPAASIVEPLDAKRAWVFKTSRNDILMASAIAGHGAKRGVKMVAFIGFGDACGEIRLEEFGKAAAGRFACTDTSVTALMPKARLKRPDAALIVGAGTPAALPQKTPKARGDTGAIHQTHGVANNDFLRVCGKGCEGAYPPGGPILVADRLPDSNPVKPSALAYRRAHENAYGAGTVSTYVGHVWDAALHLPRAIPIAQKGGQPGTPAFRSALRTALENAKDDAGAPAVFDMSAAGHAGLDERARA
ncbi:periplasmic binding family protein [Burkholderia oklahomensis]|uniref:Periplasmic binding family protein n=1 Tax=Burkholderia oklahomensis TaxID=342113 RepID=A0AAI8B941_9BURK|nr:periplasmic binding family protein [Burkholderia oklahomensis]QPS38899.1 ABC transporter substrate-binding protein [Burkholderia oklahomensis]